MLRPAVEPLDLADTLTSAAVLQLQRAAYRVEADLISFEEIPPLQESLQDLVAAPLTWIGIRDEDGAVVAALAYTTDGDIVDIDRLVVSPARFRDGLGAALVASLDPAATITVSTGLANTPAHRLYESLGFARAHDEEVVPGLVISNFVRRSVHE